LRWWHSTFKDLFLDGLGPRTCGGIVVKKDFCVAAWLMAGKTMILKDANDFSVETNLCGDGFVRASGVRSKQHENGCGDQQHPDIQSSFSRSASHMGLGLVQFQLSAQPPRPLRLGGYVS